MAVLGLVVGAISLFVGAQQLALTREAVDKTLTAAEAARDATNEMLLRIHALDAIEALTVAIQMMGTNKDFHRLDVWPTMPNRYADIRSKLQIVRDVLVDLPQHDKTIIQQAVQNLRSMEHKIERLLAAGEGISRDETVMLNHTTAEDVDALNELLTQIKLQHGSGSHD